MKKYVIVAESGADLSQEMIDSNGIRIAQMHVEIENKDYLDNTISMDELCGYYDRTGKVPKTAGVNPHQFEEIFSGIKKDSPESAILHVCYSAQLSCGYQSSIIADDGSVPIYRVDSKNVSIGQAFVVMKTAELLEKRPDIGHEELTKSVEDFAARTKFWFVPGNLDYLRAGGRVSNAQYLGATLLRLKPLIEVIDGLMISTKKYSGLRKNIIKRMIDDFFTKCDIERDKVFLVYACAIDETVKAEIEKQVLEIGVKEIVWLKTGAVITSHSGPGGIGIAGIEKRK